MARMGSVPTAGTSRIASLTGTEEKAEGLERVGSGIDYQVKLLMLFARRGYEWGQKYKYIFELRTEMKEAGKFDDVVFRYKENKQDKKWKYRFLQAKHKQKSNKITVGQLLSSSTGQAFSLLKYFSSYIEIRESFKGDTVESLIICTNTDFEYETGQPTKLKPAKATKKGGEKRGEDFYLEKIQLVDKILNLGGTRYKFSSDSVKKVKIVSNLKSEFTAAIKNIEKKKERKEDEKSILHNVGSIDQAILGEEIDRFLDKLVFAVSQPDGKGLDDIIKKEIGEEFLLLDTSITSKFQESIWNYMIKVGKDFLSGDEIKEFFKKAKRAIRTIAWSNNDYYMEIKGFNLDFEKEAKESIELKEFLNSEKKVFQLTVQQAQATLLSSIKVYRILEDIKKESIQGLERYTLDDGHTFLSLNRLLKLPVLQSVVTSGFESENSGNLLVMECDITRNDENIEELCDKLARILNSNPNKKIILITQENDALIHLFKDTVLEYEEKRDEKNSLIDLTPESQKKLLEKNVIFQGQKISLGKLLDENSKELVDSEVLSKLLSQNNIEIGREPASLGEVEDYYISRTFYHRIKIKESCFKAINISNLFAISSVDEDELFRLVSRENIRRFEDYYPDRNNPIRFILCNDEKAEENFKQLCGDYPEHTVHLLKKIGHQWIWKQTRGSLHELSQYVERDDTDLAEISDRVAIIADAPGMGKSTVLTYLAKQEKNSDASLWVLKINLLDYVDQLYEMSFHNKDKLLIAIDFLSRTEKLETALGKKLLEYRLTQQGKIVLFFDGFDEIIPDYKAKVIQLIQILKDSLLEKVWITTRPHIQSDLEDKLCVFSYTLKPFSENDQINFLKRFWKKSLNLDEMNEERLGIYTEKLLSLLSHSIRDEEIEFMGIPLQTRMLAEAFQEDFKKFCSSTQETPNLPKSIDLLGLYQRFIESKYTIYYTEKMQADIKNPAVKSHYKKSYEADMQEHRQIAFGLLFPEQAEDLLQNRLNQEELSYDKLARIGIVQIINGETQFIHRTFAEYLIADWLANKLANDPEFVRQFLKKQLFENTNDVIRHFLDRLLAREHEMHAAVLNSNEEVRKLLLNNANYVNDIDNLGRIPLHLAASYGHEKIVEQLVKQNKESINIFDTLDIRPLCYAVISGQVEVLNLLLCESAISEKQQEMLNAALIKSIQRSNGRMLSSLLEYANPQQRQEMFSEDNYAAFKYTIKRRDSLMLSSLLEYANVQQRLEVFSAVDYITAFEGAVQEGDILMLNSLLKYTNYQQRQEMLRAIDYVAVFQDAVQRYDIATLSSFLAYANNEQCQEMLRSIDYVTVFKAATQKSNRLAYLLLVYANFQQQHEMLKAVDYVAVFKNSFQETETDLLRILLIRGNFQQRMEMLNAIDYVTAIKDAVQKNDTFTLQSLLVHANLQQQQEMLSALDYVAAFQDAFQRHDSATLSQLLRYTNDQQRQEMLSTDNYAAFKDAIQRRDSAMLNLLLEYTNAQQRREMFKEVNYVDVFKEAVEESDSLILESLLQYANDQQRQEMLETVNYVDVFQNAVQIRDSITLNSLLKYANTQQRQEMFKAIDYSAVFKDAVQVHDDITLNSLIKYANAQQRQEALSTVDYVGVLKDAIKGRDSSILSLLLRYANDQQRQEMFSVDNYAAFKDAVQESDSLILRSLSEYASIQQRQEMLRVVNYTAAFKHAAQKNDAWVLISLLEYTNAQQKQEMLRAIDYVAAFKDAAQEGDHDMVKSLLGYTNTQQQQEMLEAVDYVAVFQNAVQIRDNIMLSSLLKYANIQQRQNMIKAVDYIAVFKDAVTSSALTLTSLLEYANVQQQQEMLRAIDYVTAFRIFVERHESTVLSALLEYANGQQKQEMLRAIDYVTSFQIAVERRESTVLSALLEYANDQQKQEMLRAIDYVAAFEDSAQENDSFMLKTLLKYTTEEQRAMLRAENYAVLRSPIVQQVVNQHPELQEVIEQIEEGYQKLKQQLELSAEQEKTQDNGGSSSKKRKI